METGYKSQIIRKRLNHTIIGKAKQNGLLPASKSVKIEQKNIESSLEKIKEIQSRVQSCKGISEISVSDFIGFEFYLGEEKISKVNAESKLLTFGKQGIHCEAMLKKENSILESDLLKYDELYDLASCS